MYSIVIHQPEYLPWMNLFLKISKCEKFIFLDNVQYSRRSFQNRNIISKNEKLYYLTVPLKYSERNTLIKDIQIDYSQNWIEDHISKIKNCYSNTTYYDEVSNLIYEEYKKKYRYLNDLNKSLIKKFSKKMNLKCEFISANSLDVFGKKSDLILNICKHLKASEYITGMGSKNYLEEEKFLKEKIKILYQKPKDNEYHQLNSKKFIQNLSIIDFLFNMGFKKFFKLKF